jgi:hypothetical protein
MMVATLRIRRQLADAPGLVRWASVVAGPTEFWTVTVWESRHDMQEFMRSGAHEEIMWLFSHWLESFWLMRWRPGPQELGTWKGTALAQPEPAYEKAGPPQNDALAQALEHLPRLKAATGADGSASYENSPFARRRRAEVGHAGGLMVHLKTSPVGTWRAVRVLRQLQGECQGHPSFIRAVVGVGRPGEVYLMAVWRDRDGARQLLSSPRLQDARRRWPDGCWANEWIPENEFGHWDGARLRRTRQRSAIQMPPGAHAAIETPEDRAHRQSSRAARSTGATPGAALVEPRWDRPPKR